MKYVISSIFCGLVLMASAVHAHGNAHPIKVAFDPAAIEQKDFGHAGNPKQASRTIYLSMNDKMRFMPNEVTIKKGETIKFVVLNKGRILHEMVIGTHQELEQHAEMMRKFPGMEHDEPYMAHVRPGKSQTVVWHFNRTGDFEFGCLLPGHFEAGMKGRIRVIAAGNQAAR